MRMDSELVATLCHGAARHRTPLFALPRAVAVLGTCSVGTAPTPPQPPRPTSAAQVFHGEVGVNFIKQIRG